MQQHYPYRLFPVTVFLLCAAALLRAPAYAQVDTVYPGSGHLRTSALQPGLKQYLVYYQRPGAGKTLWCWYWIRDIAVETRNGEKVYAIHQQWLGSDTASYRVIFSLNRAKDFAPLYHTESGNGKTNAYNWSAAGIAGADTVEANAQKDFALAFDRPNFNWNLDIETFEMLPLAEGRTFAINFYDAGREPPEFVLYKVTGSEQLTLLGQVQVDCWKLATTGSYNGVAYTQTFWISKQQHELLKEEDVFDKMFRCKIKLPRAAPKLTL
ncbi:DUF3108 domain-containing protein [Chitinophaga japonensis]|uniref:Uncharacterized protein n=1 Tax=Chitinophaga japonensis TaxID=104662 RepID=A0A562SS34_CHIJA|nr:hypothetical protein [Chitinophaga japonensis]TWI84055.1 hypothetical protein LX66_4417 [Chitinophaga japonensis]